MLKELVVDNNDMDDEINLPTVKKATLEKIIEFCEYIHENSPPKIAKPLRSSNLSNVVNEWYANFVNLEQKFLFELIMAAYSLKIESLLKLACAKVSLNIKGMTIPQIRIYFKIENDFTPEEEAQIKDLYKWAEE